MYVGHRSRSGEADFLVFFPKNSSPPTEFIARSFSLRAAAAVCLVSCLASCAPVHLVCVPDSIYTSDVCQRAVRVGAR